MQTLAKQYKKNGYIYKEVWRSGQVAVYSQHSAETGKITAYEVFEIIVRKEANLGGRVIPEHESCPGNEQWGQKGWTCWQIFDAMAKAEYLLGQKNRRRMKEGITK